MHPLFVLWQTQSVVSPVSKAYSMRWLCVIVEIVAPCKTGIVLSFYTIIWEKRVNFALES